MLTALREVARRLGVERQALAVRRRLLPAHVREDIRDHEQLVALLGEVLRPDSNCVDAGAHAGSVLREIVALAPLGRHIAWEPLPDFAKLLAAEFPSVEVREAALSDNPGERDFAHLLERPGWSGFHARPVPGAATVESIRVRCERLDDVVPADLRIDLIKLDVEGAEEEVLRGAVETLRRDRPVIAFEHGLGSAEYYGTTPLHIHDLLVRRLGYEIYGLAGEGPYGAARFAEIFARRERVNFLARHATQGHG
jgi:FkbM family methyltransferase